MSPAPYHTSKMARDRIPPRLVVSGAVISLSTSSSPMILGVWFLRLGAFKNPDGSTNTHPVHSIHWKNRFADRIREAFVCTDKGSFVLKFLATSTHSP